MKRKENTGRRDEVEKILLELSALEQKALFEKYLDTKNIPVPDLLIRTAGEMRISNFLLWQIAYSEFYFSQKLWPDFSHEDFLEAIKSFSSRKRRFGRR